MKKVFFICVMLLFISLSVTMVSAQDYEDFSPTPPPKVPAADFTADGAKYLDILYLNYDGKGFEMTGYGIGFNYVGAFDQIGYNIGVGFQYLTGEDDDGYIDMYFISIPLNANLAFRVAGEAHTSNLVLFGGLHYNYSYTEITADPGLIDPYEHDVEIHLWVYGPLFGAKATIPLGRTVKFIPYYALKRDIIDAEVYVDGDEISGVDVPSATSHLFGFDIELGAISIGTMLDFFNSADNDMIVIYLTWNLDYGESKESPSDETPSDETPPE
jgi:hypothetical protein